MIKHLLIKSLLHELAIGFVALAPLLGFLCLLSSCGCVFYNTSPPILFCR